MVVWLVAEKYHTEMEPVITTTEVFLSEKDAVAEVERLGSYWNKSSGYSAFVYKFIKE
jgi:hypothetical protein